MPCGSSFNLDIGRPENGAGAQKLQLIFRLSSDLEGGARLKSMADPVFLTAIAGVSLSGLVSAFRVANWFMRGDPRAIAQAGRWGGVGLFALCFPLLLGLSINQKWTEAFALAAVLLAFFALYAPRLIAPLLPRRRLALDDSAAAGPAGDYTDLREEERVERSIAVLEAYLQRKTGARAPEPESGQDFAPRIAASRPMPEAEALSVLGLGPDARDEDVQKAHRRLMQILHPDRGGSAYFVAKLNEARHALIGRTMETPRRDSLTHLDERAD
jgi:hypothetical protein